MLGDERMPRNASAARTTRREECRLQHRTAGESHLALHHYTVFTEVLMTRVQRAAQIFGIGFLLVGVLGFVVSGTSMESDPATAPHLLGLFPVNLLHNIVHTLFGLWGLAASRSFGGAKSYCQISGVLYLGLALLGFVMPSTMGLMPIGGHDIWLHAVLGLGLAVAGFTAHERSMHSGTMHHA
jgi:hypothetical protein